MFKNKTKKGITLISLVITIILLLILATVAISLAVDSDGLFSKAGEAANKWNTSVANEGTALENLMQMANSLGGTTPPPSTLPEGWNPDAVVDTVEEGDRIAPIPDGYVASKVSTEDQISEGLVIYETDVEVNDANHDTALTSYNQYVWIPVDDINDMVMCQTGGAAHTLNEKTLQCTTCGEATKLAGKLYLDEQSWEFDTDATGQTYSNDDVEPYVDCFREPDDLWNASSGDRSSTGISAIKAILNNQAATTYEEIKEDWNELLQTDFENMAKSVAKYGGFYISRYEIGAGGTSKKGQVVLNNSGSTNWWTLFNTLRSNPETESPVYSQMIWGSQYDQVIKFLDEDETNEPTVSHDDRDLSLSPAVSGNAPLDEMSNIYDLEGNYSEWTVESKHTCYRVGRGECFSTVEYANNGGAGVRNSDDGFLPTSTGGSLSSRLALYVTI